MEVSASVFRNILYAAASRDADLGVLCDKIGIHPSDLDKSQKRFGIDLVEMAFQHSIELTDDPLFGLHIGEKVDFSAFGIVGFVMKSSPDVVTALKRGCYYNNLASGIIKVGFETDEEVGIFRTAALPLIRENYRLTTRNGVEETMSFIVKAVQKLSGKNILPRAVHFAFPFPKEHIKEYERIFPCALFFGKSKNVLEYGIQDLKTPVVGYNQGLFELLNIQAQQILDSLSHGESFTKKVRRTIVQGFNHQFPSIESVAAEMNMSVRSLQRKLSAEEGTFKDILDDIRKEFALRYLKNKALSISEVGYLLGFSEPSVFSRTFKRWMGHSPKEYILSYETHI